MEGKWCIWKNQYSVSARKELLWSILNLIQSDSVYYYGGEDNQAFCLEIAIRERVYVLLRTHNYRHLLIIASLEASKDNDCKASPSTVILCILCLLIMPALRSSRLPSVSRTFHTKEIALSLRYEFAISKNSKIIYHDFSDHILWLQFLQLKTETVLRYAVSITVERNGKDENLCQFRSSKFSWDSDILLWYMD